ncbi:MAG: helix-turn-helix domain-containing protein [Gemmatimonadota bacterium]
MEEKFVIKRLDQLRAISDSLRWRLVEALAAKELTIAGLAKQLREPASKLYHHMDILLEAGLIRVVRREQKRGAEERSFRAAAKDFTVDDAVFSFEPGEAGAEELIDAVSAALTGVADDLAKAVRAGAVDLRRDGRKVFIETQDLGLTEQEFIELCGKLDRWIDEGKSRSRPGRKSRYRFGVAFFPTTAVERSHRKGKPE